MSFWWCLPFRFDENVDREATTELTLMSRWIPARLNAVHVCIDDSPFKALLARMITSSQPKNLSVVHRIHKGTPTELQYSLMGYGIDVDSLPIMTDGTAKNNNQKKFLARKKAKEAHLAQHGPGSFKKVEMPFSSDILMGKGSPFQRHIGNINMRILLENHVDEYMSATLQDKVDLTWRLVAEIKQGGGRFLKKDKDDWWIEASDQAARDKIGKGLVTQATAKQKSNLPNKSKENSQNNEPQVKRLKPSPLASPTPMAAAPPSKPSGSSFFDFCQGGDTYVAKIDKQQLLWG